MCAHTCKRKPGVDVRHLSEPSVFTLFTEAMSFIELRLPVG